MLLALELSGLNSLPLHILGGAFLIGRLMHGAGANLKSGIVAVGATINYVVLLTMAVWLVVRHFCHG